MAVRGGGFLKWNVLNKMPRVKGAPHRWKGVKPYRIILSGKLG
jgi:hypothetical protein